MKRVTLLFLGSLIVASSLYAKSEETMAKELMKLRAQVEELSSKIQDEKESTKATMRSLVMQKNELEANIGRQELKIKQLTMEMEKLKKHIQEVGSSAEGLKEVVDEAIGKLANQIKKELPFKTKERLEDLLKIKQDMDNNVLTPQKALARVWNSYSDEVRLTKENGLFKQTINLDGKDKLAEVARLGMVMLYFKTPDDHVGYAIEHQDNWGYKEVRDKEKRKLILNLFDSMHKQIRTGFFTLPDAIAKSKVER